jgi:hypothetical protein
LPTRQAACSGLGRTQIGAFQRRIAEEQNSGSQGDEGNADRVFHQVLALFVVPEFPKTRPHVTNIDQMAEFSNIFGSLHGIDAALTWGNVACYR